MGKDGKKRGLEFFILNNKNNKRYRRGIMVTVKIEKTIRKLISLAIVYVIVLLLASSCGDGGLGAFFAGGGISGTGRFSGIITGFGSVFVNGVEIETTGAQISIDKNINANEGELKVGMKVQIEATDNVADIIVYKSEIKGPISSITTTNSFLVLGQTVKVDGTTVFEGINGLVGLNADDIVEVSGFANALGDILATFVELKNSSLTEFKVIGTVSELDEINKTFKINDLIINYGGINLPTGIANTTVEVEGTMPGSIMMATEIAIEDSFFSSGDEVEFEGVITSITPPSDFVVNSQRVQTTSLTTYEHGTALNIAVNVRVEIKGSVNSSNILIAEKVEFRFVESKGIEIKGEVESIDTDNSTVTVFGITIHVDANTGLKDESDQELRPFTLANVQDGDPLEIGGFVDGDGNVIAGKLEREDSIGSGEFELSGPVESENLGNKTIEILGVTVNLNGAFSGDNSEATAFFDAVEIGDIVEVNGSFTNSTFFATEADIKLEI
jgi:hypothetical protein